MPTRLRSLAVTFPALLAVIVLMVALVTARMVERQMGDVLIGARGAELASGSGRVATMLAAGLPALRESLAVAVARPEIQAILAPELDSAVAARRLGSLLPMLPDSIGRVTQLIDRTGRVLVEHRHPPDGVNPFLWASRSAAAGGLDTTSLSIGPILSVDGGEVVFGLALPVRDDAGRLRGWYAEERRIRARGVDDVRALIGVGTMLVGQPDTGVWTDLEREATGPTSIAAFDTVLRVRVEGRGDVLGLATRIPESPWVLWVEDPAARVLAPVDALFARLWPAVGLIALLGAGLAWMLGRVAAVRIRAVAAEIDRTLAPQGTAEPEAMRSADDELAALERSYSRMESRLAKQRRLDEQLLQSQKLEAVGRMAGGIAHDFNNLLTVITNYGGLVQERLSAASPEAEDMAEVLRAADRAAALSRRLLSFSRQHLVDPRPVDLNGAVAGVNRLVARLVPSNIERQVDLASTPLTVLIDEVQLEQILLNLVLNAADAMPAGGRLTLRTTREEFNAEHPSRGLLPEGTYACVTVSDTGVGMDAATVAQIFDPFFTTKPVGKGTGLGLATVHGIAAQARGTVTAASKPGSGTRMEVYLPLCEQSAADSSRPGAAIPARTAEHGLLLVVEDDDGTREVTRRLLVHAGYSVEVFTRADAALEWLQQEPRAAEARAVVTDVMMPGISGVELVRRVGELRPSLPFVLMSGYTDTGERLSDLPGARPVILDKPFTVEALLDAVAQAVTR